MLSTFETALAAHRFGVGAAPGELDALGDDAPALLYAQTFDRTAALARWPGLFGSSFDAMRQLIVLRDNRGSQPGVNVLGHFRRDARRALPQAIEQRMWQAVESTTPFLERLVWFWSNHFAISAAKRPVAPFAEAFEREAIRPHILGSFADMLLAVERHPAMLIYLDNVFSTGPQSALARNGGGSGGLNENLAREILELHTLGVDGGYGQNDVENLARIITGWTIPMVRRHADTPPDDAFYFSAEAHEPGAKLLLGRRYGEAGEQEGIDALHDLAMEEATARHLATKLARHFIADDPSPEMIARMASAYLENDASLGALTRAMLADPRAWTPERVKLRQPAELVAAAARALALQRSEQTILSDGLATLDHRPLLASSPKGYDDRTAAWSGPEAVVLRIEWCGQAAARSSLSMAPQDFAAEVLGPLAGSRMLDACAMAPGRQAGFALALASPEFQWR